ncbi:MAG TPA: universal stress protein [Pseudonocardiaceae bacterium]|jgi:nucleotide-binding universal stress UspA family protein
MTETFEGRPIVVGIDGSASAGRAAMWAADEATRRHTGLKLVTAVGTAAFSSAGGFVPPQAFFDELESQARALLTAAQTEVREAYPALDVQVRLCGGGAAAALLDESKGAALVVLGSRDADGGHLLTGGSVAVGLGAHGQCPTVVVRGAGPLPTSGPVVVGVDGSPASELAVALAFEEASARGAELVAVHAWIEYGSGSIAQYVADWSFVETHEREVLAERLAGWQEKYPDVTVRRVLSEDKAVHLLLSCAEGAQLLVVGNRGHGGFTGLLLGSTSRKLIHSAPCPLMVARPTESG